MRKPDTIQRDGKTYVISWRTAIDGRTLARVTTTNTQGATVTFGCWKTKKAARQYLECAQHITF